MEASLTMRLVEWLIDRFDLNRNGRKGADE
jgi:hypothetical protein